MRETTCDLDTNCMRLSSPSFITPDNEFKFEHNQRPSQWQENTIVNIYKAHHYPAWEARTVRGT